MTDIILDTRRFEASVFIPHESLRNAKVDLIEVAAQGLVVKLRHEVYGEKLRAYVHDVWFVHEFRFPSTPWQHLKERFAPSWFCYRFPVQYTTYKSREHKEFKLTDWALFPDIDTKRYGTDMGKVVFRSEAEDGTWD